MGKLNVVKITDVYGWAYWWIAKEMAKYSSHNVTPQLYNQVDYSKMDVCLISGPDISYSISGVQIPNECKKRGIKVIGQYSGERDLIYSHADLIVTISPILYFYAKKKYKNIPVIYLPESIDTNFFPIVPYNEKEFYLGWAGSKNRPLKRTYLLDKLNTPHKIKAEHGKQFFNKEGTLDHMVEFYKTIQGYVCLSTTECMPRVVAESMASGLPVISTNVGSIPLLLNENWIVPIYPDEEVIKQINERLDLLRYCNGLRKEVGQRNAEYIRKHFSWEVNIPLWDDVFNLLKQDTINDIIDLSESWIDQHGFRLFFDNPEKYNEQLKFFETPPQRTKIEIKQSIDIFQKLNHSKIKYWIARESCLELIETKAIGIRKALIYIGTTSGNKNQLEKLLKENCRAMQENIYQFEKYYAKIDIDDNVKETFPYPLGSILVNVPQSPFVYLIQRNIK